MQWLVLSFCSVMPIHTAGHSDPTPRRTIGVGQLS